MKVERSNIQFPLWRKKVDATLFKEAKSPIPKWMWKGWDIDKHFSKCTSKKNNSSKVVVIFNKTEFSGNIIYLKSKKMYRLSFDKQLSEILKDVFLMSYIRSIEQDLRKNKPEYSGQKIVNEIPFWEFLDIEFDSINKKFYFNAHYTQKPAYIELFKELVKSHTLKLIDDLVNSKEEFRFIKQDWIPRDKLKTQIDAKNVIYNLIDTQNKLIYIGEARKLNLRLNQKRNGIKNWDYYRFDCLPEGLNDKQRKAIERLMIRTFASFFKNKKGVLSKEVSEYVLSNDRIDI